MKPETIREIREALKAATPGPWAIEKDEPETRWSRWRVLSVETVKRWWGYGTSAREPYLATCVEDTPDVSRARENAQLIALLRNHAEEMLDAAERDQFRQTSLEARVSQRQADLSDEIDRYKRALELAKAGYRDEIAVDYPEYSAEVLNQIDRILEGGDE